MDRASQHFRPIEANCAGGIKSCPSPPMGGPSNPQLVTDLLTNITGQWVQLSNGMIVTPGHLFARPQGGFMSIADVLRLDGQILDAHGFSKKCFGHRATICWIHDIAEVPRTIPSSLKLFVPRSRSCPSGRQHRRTAASTGNRLADLQLYRVPRNRKTRFPAKGPQLKHRVFNDVRVHQR